MAKTKKNRKRSKPSDGDELIDDSNAPAAVAPKAKTKTQTKKQKAAGRKTGPAASKKDGAKKAASSKKAKKTSAKAKAPSGKRPRTSVEHKAPKAGSKFTAKYKGKTHTMTVKKAKDGGVAYFVKGKAYKSPTAAASAVLTAVSRANGWTFWGIESKN